MKELRRDQTIQEHSDFRLWLQEEYTKRCGKNPSYSLRAFAALLDLDSSSVSQILTGKRKASAKLALGIFEKLGVHPTIAQRILGSLKPTAGRPSNQTKKKQSTPEPNYGQLTLDAFAVVADWYHYAIMELTVTEGFKNDPQWIARSLNISVIEVKVAIERLMRLELIEEKDGTLIQTENLLSNGFTGVTTSGAHKQLQRQVLQKALEAIDNTPQEDKDITSMTMAIDRSKLPEARKLIQKFRRDLCQFLENGKKEDIYHLGVQLYPVSKRINLKE
jgi:uncharacterized protein (TIGR02147 family)